MHETYTLTQKEYSNLKRRLTTLENRAKRVESITNYKAIIRECDHAFEVFESKGFPDNWSRWRRASDDAYFAIQMRGGWAND